MSQVYDALRRSGIEVSGLDPTSESLGTFDATGVDRVPCLRVDARPERRLVAMGEEPSVGAERIRMLGAQLRHHQEQHPLKTLLMTSSIKDEGKSIISANLAFSLAGMKQRVLLIDGDSHQGSLTRLLGASTLPGLTAWWRSNDAIVGYLRRVEALPLWFLAAGQASPRVGEMLQSIRFSEMLTHVASWFDWVIIDSPPYAPLADSAIWASRTDATLLVVRLGRTPKKLLAKVLDSFDQQKLLGVVLNDCSDPHASYYAQYYKGIQTAQADAARKDKQLHATRNSKRWTFVLKRSNL
jgi:protein-tyrosine kinase